MTINLALEYIPRKMRELGYGDNYILRFRNFNIPEDEAMTLNAFSGEFFLLIEESDFITIESDTGLYDLSDKYTNEHQYEHHGEILITNKSVDNFRTVKFIHVIPSHGKPQCETTKNCQQN
jgi:hypothetical protein